MSLLPCIDGSVDFPEHRLALHEPDGLLCYGGDLSVARLSAAYQQGIFPWYSKGEPILWWIPSDRMVLFPERLHISRSLRKAMQQKQPRFYFNRDIKRVVQTCAQIPRKDRGTWIHPEMIAAYIDLFSAGHGFCVEAEVDGQWAGGMYGVVVNASDDSFIYCGESMCSALPNGSKFVMIGLCQHMLAHGIKLLDCQLHNPHLESMGAELISKTAFLKQLSAK